MSAGERSTQPDMLTDENPNPVLSASRDGQVVYRNQAARGVLAGQGYTVTVPDEWLPVLGKAFESGGGGRGRVARRGAYLCLQVRAR